MRMIIGFLCLMAAAIKSCQGGNFIAPLIVGAILFYWGSKDNKEYD